MLGGLPACASSRAAVARFVVDKAHLPDIWGVWMGLGGVADADPRFRFPIQVLQGPNVVVIHHEAITQPRRIYMDGRSHPAPDELLPTFLGHSTGTVRTGIQYRRVGNGRGSGYARIRVDR